MSDDRSRDLRLRPVRLEDEPEAVRAHAELEAEDFAFLLGYSRGVPWPEYVAMLDRISRGERLPAGYVRATFLLAELGGHIIGRSSIRHHLNAYLAREGGHIGFGVRRAHRGRGHATTILEQSLVIARSVGVDRVLVTCDDDNIASASVIERCGGVFESLVDPADGGVPIRRYWID